MEKISVPKGLVKCKVCVEYKGSVKEKDLPTGQGPNWFSGNPQRKIRVSCLCKGPLCRRCKATRVSRPISNSFNPKDGLIWHTPYFAAMFLVCDACRKIEEQEREEMIRRRTRPTSR